MAYSNRGIDVINSIANAMDSILPTEGTAMKDRYVVSVCFSDRSYDEYRWFHDELDDAVSHVNFLVEEWTDSPNPWFNDYGAICDGDLIEEFDPYHPSEGESIWITMWDRKSDELIAGGNNPDGVFYANDDGDVPPNGWAAAMVSAKCLRHYLKSYRATESIRNGN